MVTSLFSVYKRARSASGIRNAPSEAGGEKTNESSYTQVGALFFLLALLTSSYLLSTPLSPSSAGGSSDVALKGLGTT